MIAVMVNFAVADTELPENEKQEGATD